MALFAKRHYEWIARLLRDNKQYVNMPPQAMDDMIHRFKEDNSKFNGDRFREAINKESR